MYFSDENPPSDLGTRSLIYDIGPWKGENLLTGIESFFQKNAYHPFATCGNPKCGKTGPIPLSTSTPSTNPEQNPPIRSIEHFCDGKTCFTTDPTNFRNNRHHTKDRSFLDRAGIFDFRTIAPGETIREPVAAAPSFQTCFACVHMYILCACVYICVCVYVCGHDIYTYICIYMYVCMYL